MSISNFKPGSDSLNINAQMKALEVEKTDGADKDRSDELRKGDTQLSQLLQG
ncbi:MAG: hypothetical protein HRT90_01250 [Candidatus Margulisbacteria bacterium]|nr:hypothetical protein [Candidatus Margulisiibacteriota bacterium]